MSSKPATKHNPALVASFKTCGQPSWDVKGRRRSMQDSTTEYPIPRRQVNEFRRLRKKTNSVTLSRVDLILPVCDPTPMLPKLPPSLSLRLATEQKKAARERMRSSDELNLDHEIKSIYKEMGKAPPVNWYDKINESVPV